MMYFSFSDRVHQLARTQTGNYSSRIHQALESKEFRLLWSEKASESFPKQLQHSDLPEPTNPFDKVFASAWVKNQVIVGTKDNRLIIWDTKNKPFAATKEITLPGPERPSNEPIGCGIHSIATNPSGNKLVTGARNPNDVAVFSLPDLAPISVLREHTDWVFGIDFITDDNFISGSRDSQIKVWSTKTTIPVASKQAHADKVRDVKCRPDTQKFYTIGSEGSLKIWDCNTLTQEHVVPLPDRAEIVTVSIDADGKIAAVGSQRQVALIDALNGNLIDTINSPDQDWGGVRSLAWNNHILSIGGGAGSLAFYDTRKAESIPVRDHAIDHTGPGWFLEDEDLLRPTTSGTTGRHAVFTHCYDPSKLKMFVGGGPLLLSLRGAYASIWW